MDARSSICPTRRKTSSTSCVCSCPNPNGCTYRYADTPLAFYRQSLLTNMSRCRYNRPDLRSFNEVSALIHLANKYTSRTLRTKLSHRSANTCSHHTSTAGSRVLL